MSGPSPPTAAATPILVSAGAKNCHEAALGPPSRCRRRCRSVNQSLTVRCFTVRAGIALGLVLQGEAWIASASGGREG